jgi:hypothetical protein
MKAFFTFTAPIKNERGISIVLVVILILVLLGFAALAIDYGHLYVVRNELRNAADAGALAGARVLYTINGTAINPGANSEAQAAALANKSENFPVEVNSGDVERGHWSFNLTDPATGKKGWFYANPSLTALDIWNYTTQQLDQDTNFINAIRVTAKRQSSPSIISYFAGLFGATQFIMEQKAVAWLGFAGPIPPHGTDQPLAICLEAIQSSGTGTVSCTVGRMLNSGQANPSTNNTAGWTNFTQQPCRTANPPTVSPLICAQGNPNEIYPLQGIGTTGGTNTTVFDNLMDCWKRATTGSSTGTPTTFWGPLKFLVIECPGNNISNCANVRGVISLSIIWMNRQKDPQYRDVPLNMSGQVNGSTVSWTCSTPAPRNVNERKACWNEFITAFNLLNAANQPATWQNGGYDAKSIYFLPSCSFVEPTGGPGGENYGVLAKQPRLVDWYNPYSKF